MHSFLIIGLSQFGRETARKLVRLGEEVLAVDIDLEKIDRIAGEVDARQGDCLDETVLQALDVPDYDHVIVAISEDIQASALVTTLVKEMGAKHIICQSYDEKHSRLLRRIGADYIVCPEVDMGDRIARKFSADLLDFIPLGGDQSIVEINAPSPWVGKSLRELNVRVNYGVNVIGIRKDGAEFIDTNLDPDHRFDERDTLMVIGMSQNIARMLK
ncbi:MAG: TrkA family potassium uptake protein [Clostridia bacterium]|nr:TrkA family potassium uptake protein [Clostridia bacterium]